MKVLVVLVVLGFGAVARADVPDDSVVACQHHEVGDACADGVCAKTTCSHWHPTPDGKGEESHFECVKCVAGEPVNGGAGGSRKPLLFGLGIGAVALLGGIAFAFRRGKRPT